MKQRNIATCIYLTEDNHELLKELKENHSVKFSDLINQLLHEYRKNYDMNIFMKKNRDMLKKVIFDSVQQAQTDILKRQGYVLSAIYRNTAKTNAIDDLFFKSDEDTAELVRLANKESDRKLKELKSKIGGKN